MTCLIAHKPATDSPRNAVCGALFGLALAYLVGRELALADLGGRDLASLAPGYVTV